MSSVPKKHALNAAPGPVPGHNAAGGAPGVPGQIPAPNASLLANYTLPGVISYLTSEFTNLERFKIITNLEKSEMKYKIQHLTSELNSVRYLNDKQAVRIRELEARLEKHGEPVKPSFSESFSALSIDPEISRNNSKTSKDLESISSELEAESKSEVIGSKTEVTVSNTEPNSATKADSRNPELGSESKPTVGANKPSLEKSRDHIQDIPYIDLETVRDARQTLNESIREIIDLLRPPSSSVETVGRPADSAYADLLEAADSFSFDAMSEKPRGLFERYTLKSEDLADRKAAFEDEVKELQDPVLNEPAPEESDAETVIADEVGP